MFARYLVATGELLADGLTTEPETAEGEAVAAMPPSAVAGLSVWSAAVRGYVDAPPAQSAVAALAALLVAKGVISQGEANGLPGA